MDEAHAAASRAAEAYEVLLQERRDDPERAFGLTLARMTLALVENHRRVDQPSVDRVNDDREEIQFATFQYDLAVEADRRSDRDAARRYLAESCDRAAATDWRVT